MLIVLCFVWSRDINAFVFDVRLYVHSVVFCGLPAVAVFQCFETVFCLELQFVHAFFWRFARVFAVFQRFVVAFCPNCNFYNHLLVVFSL